MAHYTVQHACGHTHTYQLFGAIKNRERKLDWLATQNCPECSRAAAISAAEADDTPVTAEIIPTVIRAQEPGTLELTIMFQGGTYRRRDELKSIAHYGELPAQAGMFGLLAGERKGWYTRCTIAGAELKDLDRPQFLALVAQKAKLPADIELALPTEMSGDLALLADRMIQAIREADALATLPPAPKCHKLIDLLGKQGYWNGKFYGRDENEIYIDGKRFSVPPEIKTQWATERSAYDAWDARRKEVIDSLRTKKA